MSETTSLLFDMIIWCQIIALVLNSGILAWLLIEHRQLKGRRIDNGKKP